MKRTFLSATWLAFFLFLGVAACAEETPAPDRSPTTIAVVVDETAVATALPVDPTTTGETAEATTVPVENPTDTPETVATAEPTAVPTEPVSYTITIDSPQPGQLMTVARDFTFSGTVNPVPSQRLEVELVAAGSASNGETMVGFADVESATGNWQLTAQLHPRRTGPATLHVRVAGADYAVPVTLRLAEDEATTIVTVNQPLRSEIVVAGQTLLISGESRNLIDGKIQVGLFGCPADSDANLLAQIEFAAGNGPWRAQIILPETAAADCDTARLRVTTGGLMNNNPEVAWSSDQFLTLVTASDERANIFTVWDPTLLRFIPGQAALVIGTAVNPIEGVIQVELVQDETVIARETAVPDRFGYWETSLTPPATAEPGDVQLRLSTGADDAYREFIFPATLGS